MADENTPQSEELDFTKFFGEAAKADGTPAADPPVAADPPAAVDPPAVVADPPATVVPPVVVDPPAAADPPVDINKLITDAVAATAAAFKPQAPDTPAVVATPAVDPEVESKIQKFREDWPEHAAVMDIALKTQADALAAKFQELLAPVMGQLAPILANDEAQAQAAHEAAILKEHADAESLLPDIEKWVGAKPAYLQKAYNEVLESGAAQDVVALISEFKKETGKVVPVAPVVPDPAVARRIRSTEPVGGIRQDGTSGVIDPNDFEGAFRAAASEAQKAA